VIVLAGRLLGKDREAFNGKVRIDVIEHVGCFVEQDRKSPVATTFAGRPISLFMRSTMPSIMAT